jgi:hypothetical protein
MRHWPSACLIAILGLTTVGCQFPRDPEGTLERVQPRRASNSSLSGASTHSTSASIARELTHEVGFDPRRRRFREIDPRRVRKYSDA